LSFIDLIFKTLNNSPESSVTSNYNNKYINYLFIIIANIILPNCNFILFFLHRKKACHRSETGTTRPRQSGLATSASNTSKVVQFIYSSIYLFLIINNK